MSMPVTSFYYIEKVGSIIKALTDSKFDGFPIRNSAGQVVGLIGRHHLMVILDNIEDIIKNDKSAGRGKSGKPGEYSAIESFDERTDTNASI
jgi:hypothetical protein